MKRFWLPGPAALAALLVVLPAGRAPLFANDLFFHLAAGRWWLEHHQFPAVDPFSPTATAQAPHEWVWGVLCELSVRALGGAGPRLLVAAVLLATFAVLWKCLSPDDEPRGALWRVVFFGAALSTQQFTWEQERPYHLAHLAFAAWWWAVWRWKQAPTRASAAMVVLVSALWANLHGSWVLGPIALGALLLGQWLDGTFRRGGLGLLAACIGAAALHPAGVSNLLYPVQHQFLASTQTILEWLPLDFSFPFTWVLIGLLVLVVARTAQAPTVDRWSTLLPALALTLAAFWSRRHAPFAGMALAIAAVQVMKALEPPIGLRLGRWGTTSGGLVWPVLVLLLGAWQAGRHPRTLEASLDPDWYPKAALAELQRRPPGRVLAKFEWGGLVSALAGPSFQTYIDSRNDPYPREIHDGYHAMRALKPGWKETFDAFHPDYVLWGGVDFSWPLVVALEAEGWTRVAEDELGVLLVRP